MHLNLTKSQKKTTMKLKGSISWLEYIKIDNVFVRYTRLFSTKTISIQTSLEITVRIIFFFFILKNQYNFFPYYGDLTMAQVIFSIICQKN